MTVPHKDARAPSPEPPGTRSGRGAWGQVPARGSDGRLPESMSLARDNAVGGLWTGHAQGAGRSGRAGGAGWALSSICPAGLGPSPTRAQGSGEEGTALTRYLLPHRLCLSWSQGGRGQPLRLPWPCPHFMNSPQAPSIWACEQLPSGPRYGSRVSMGAGRACCGRCWPFLLLTRVRARQPAGGGDSPARPPGMGAPLDSS